MNPGWVFKSFFVFLFFFLLISSASLAADKCDKTGCTTKIYSLTIDLNGIGIVPTANVYSSASPVIVPIVNCVPDSKLVFKIYKSHPNYAPIYNALISARLTGQPIVIKINEGSNPCTVNNIVLGDISE